MNNYIICKLCDNKKPEFLFVKSKATKSGYLKRCKKCENLNQQDYRMSLKNNKYPYLSGKYKCLKDPKYIKDKRELFFSLDKKRRNKLGLNW